MITDNWNNHHKGKVGPIDLDADTERQLKLYGIEMKAGEQGKYFRKGYILVSCKHEPPELMSWRAQTELWSNLASMVRDYLCQVLDRRYVEVKEIEWVCGQGMNEL